MRQEGQNPMHIASGRPVDEEDAAGDQRDRDGKSRRQRLVQDSVAAATPNSGAKNVKADSRAAE